MFWNQAPTTRPHWPSALNPVCNGMITLRFPCLGFPPMMSLPSVASTSLKGVSSMDLPAYLFSSGFMSKLSTWLTPPQRKIQMTDLARGGKCGLPSGGRQLEAGESARATPSRNKMAESASPVKPIPVSRRKERRVMPAQRPGARTSVRRVSAGEEGLGIFPRASALLAFLRDKSRAPLWRGVELFMAASSDGDEIVVIEKHEHQVFA